MSGCCDLLRSFGFLFLTLVNVVFINIIISYQVKAIFTVHKYTVHENKNVSLTHRRQNLHLKYIRKKHLCLELCLILSTSFPLPPTLASCYGLSHTPPPGISVPAYLSGYTSALHKSNERTNVEWVQRSARENEHWSLPANPLGMSDADTCQDDSWRDARRRLRGFKAGTTTPASVSARASLTPWHSLDPWPWARYQTRQCWRLPPGTGPQGAGRGGTGREGGSRKLETGMGRMHGPVWLCFWHRNQ